MASCIAKWANAPEAEAPAGGLPLRGQAGILMLPEAQIGEVIS
jgi:hypothetical protein